MISSQEMEQYYSYNPRASPHGAGRAKVLSQSAAENWTDGLSKIDRHRDMKTAVHQ